MDRARIATLRDAGADEHLERSGYHSFRVLTSEVSAALREQLLACYPAERRGFHSSVESRDLNYRAEVHRLVVAALGPFVERHTVDQQIVNTALVIKWPEGAAEVPIHQDWTFVDEDIARSVNLYCALSPSDPVTGGLRILPGSHHVARRVRFSRGWPDGYHDPAQELEIAELRPLTLATGEGAFTDNALVHASGPNRSAEPRVSIVVALAPRSVPVRHHVRRGDDLVEAFAVDDVAFFQRFVPGDEPTELRSIGTSALEPAPFTVDDLRSLCRTAPRYRPAGRAPRRGLSRRRRTFASTALQRRFERDGYVVVDLLDQEALESLQLGYDALDHRLEWDSPFANGFHTTIFDPRSHHRRDVLATVEDHLGPALDRLLVDHRVFFANFTVKASGGGPVPVHLDWTFVDERRFRSATVWCALADVGTDGGALGVEIGSHRSTDYIRAVNQRDYDQQAERGDPSRRTLVGLRAGQAIIMDNRTIHFSAPNSSPHLRVAATCVIAPREAALHHYWVGDQGDLHRFTVERSFYLHYTPGELPGTRPGVLADDIVHGAVIG